VPVSKTGVWRLGLGGVVAVACAAGSPVTCRLDAGQAKAGWSAKTVFADQPAFQMFFGWIGPRRARMTKRLEARKDSRDR
jgi:hypothetical protein